MGLIVIALITLVLAFGRRGWARLRGKPLPRLKVRPAFESPEPGTPQDGAVLVAGAGPSGLMTAALLVRQGVAVRIVDANAGPSTESRAFAVQARTIELFRWMGLADELLSHGVIDTGIRFHIRGRPVGGLDFDRARAADTPYQFILMAPQNEVEQILLDDLARHGVTVERDTRVEVVDQDQDHVRVRLNGRDLAFRHLVGADGSHSVVRKQLGLDFTGDGYAQRFLLADCTVDWPFDHTNFRVFMNGERIGLFLPLDGARRSRVMTTDPGGPDTLEALESSLRAAMNVPVTLSDPVWMTRYQAHLRQVERYRVGRVFLVGDAAHIHSPAGGQGLNTGLQDAANLAWKIAAALRGAGDGLLESYHDERHPVGVDLLRFTDRLYRVAADLHGGRAWLRDRLGPFLLGRMSAAPRPHRKAFRRLSQIGLAYRPGPYAVNELLLSLTGPWAGQRAPDAPIRTGRQMFDLLAGYRLHVVAFSRKHLDDAAITRLTEQLDGLPAHIVGRVACRRDERVELVGSVQVFEAYGLVTENAQALYVIRPDGYVAWRCDELDVDACRAFLARIPAARIPADQERVA